MVRGRRAVLLEGLATVRELTAVGALALAIATLTVAVAVPAALVAEPAAAGPVQPPQPKSGPGGSDYPHRGVRVSSGGTGFDAWHVFEPTRPRPRRAPVAVVLHGYYEYAGYAQHEAFIRHTVRKGSIVIHPRWQTGLADPCPGPYDIEPCIRSAVAGIQGALTHLRTDAGRVRPDTDRASYFGFSFGGVLAANLANRHRLLGVPRPRAIFLDDPHDGGLAGLDEPAVDDSLAGIPRDVRLQCHSGADGVLAEAPNASCNAIYPKLGHIPATNRSLVATRTDRHGRPALSSAHGVCSARAGQADAYDWNFCWKVWDAMRACAGAIRLPGQRSGSRARARLCRSAFGATPEHRSNGRWSDGRPVTPLKVAARAPIRP
jgi:pimeloyl-ACP methyl ester carboxylesterase